MNGNSILADTNILIYLTNGNEEIAELLRDKILYAAEITEIECLSYQGLNAQDIKVLESLFRDVSVIKMNDEIKKECILLKRKYSLKLPDAVIAATSKFINCPLITADKKFRQIEELDLIFYDV